MSRTKEEKEKLLRVLTSIECLRNVRAILPPAEQAKVDDLLKFLERMLPREFLCLL